MNSYCQNCLFPLDPSEYGQRHCGACQSRGNEAREGAVREGKSPDEVQDAVNNALMERNGLRRRTAHADSRTPIQRIQRQALEERLKIERGSVNDPRRARLPQ